jgi:hypothetical protein
MSAELAKVRGLWRWMQLLQVPSSTMGGRGCLLVDEPCRRGLWLLVDMEVRGRRSTIRDEAVE